MTLPLMVLWLAMATGLWLVVQAFPYPAAPALADRVLPYLGRPRLRALAGFTPPSHPGWRRTIARHGLSVSAHVARVAGGDVGVMRRLETLGGVLTLEQFRLEQIMWAAGAAAATSLLLVLRGIEVANLGPSLLVVSISAVLGLLARDRSLTRQVDRRSESLRAELPTVVEMLAMAVSAGAGLTGALERVSRLGSGVMAGELHRVLADVRVGLPLVPALQRMADRNTLPELRRFVDSVTVSVERGTPLADVLVAQAADAREAERRALIESGGRKEIAMMVPVVFLVLPLSVLFVLFPGFYGLQLGS